MTYNVVLLIAVIALMVIMSIVSFALYGKDKKLAVQGQPRIKEKVLLSVAVFFGAFGAFIGRKVHHHKTDKIYFSITIYLSMLSQIIMLALAVYGAIAL